MSELASFGEWIRRRRRALDLTREALAQQVGCAAATIRKIETDERRPSRQVAERLAVCLRLPADQQHAFLEAARGGRAVDRLAAPAPVLEQSVAMVGAYVARVAAPAPERTSEPPPRPGPPHNLPIQLTALLGREGALAELVSLLARPAVRLVTITGPGGIGKTRLALQVAAEALQDFPDGAWFVDLAAIQRPELILPAIARALNVAEPTDLRLRERLVAHLEQKQLLLLLDNLEHVVAGAPELAALLGGAPRVKALVTSRTPLNLRGEHCYALAPLALPPQAGPKDIQAYPATALFIERAQTVRPTFAVTEANSPAIAAICERLDGLPLAIELTAARVPLFTPEVLLKRLEQPLALLTRGPRDLPQRQQTLRSTIDWSYQLLDADAQRLFRALGAFTAGAGLDQIAAICAGDQVADAILDQLAALVNHSLVQADLAAAFPRFSMLETIRSFAREQLDAHGERNSIELRHALHFSVFAEQAAQAIMGPDQAAWLQRTEQEYPHLRAALAWSQQRGQNAERRAEIGLQLLGALGGFWHSRGYWAEGYQWFAALYASPERVPATAAGARALRSAGLMRYAREEFATAEALYAQSLAIWRALGDQAGVAEMLWLLGRIAFAREDIAAARPFFEEALLHYRALGDPRGCAATLNLLGDVASCDPATLDAAEALYQESLTLAHTAGAVSTAAFVLGNLGRLAKTRGALDQASAYFTECLALARELGNQAMQIWMLERLSELATQQGEYVIARSYLEEGLAIAQRLPSHWGIGSALRGLGVLAEREGSHKQAIAHYRDAAQHMYLANVHSVAIDALGLLARALLATGQHQAAARLYGATAVAAQVLGQTIDAITPVAGSDLPAEAAALREQLDPPTFAAAWAAGQALSLEQAVAYAQTV